MNQHTQPGSPNANPAQSSPDSLTARIPFMLTIGFWGGLLFTAAGSVAWRRGWLQVGLIAGLFLLNYFVLKRVNPAVLAARQKNNQPLFFTDRLISYLFFACVMATPWVAGKDALRHHWMAANGWLVAGIILQLAGNGLILWSMAVNPFLEQFVRIQSDRGHQVVSRGAYRLVRHPMYAGVILLFAGMPLLLGSARAFLPAAGVAAALTLRTAFEDRTLRRALPGYEEFTRRTRQRLLPGIW